MSTTLTMNEQCSRCTREERREVSLKEAAELSKSGLQKPAAVKIFFDGEEVIELDSLCNTCRKIVLNHAKIINKKLTQKSSFRTKKKKKKDEDED